LRGLLLTGGRERGERREGKENGGLGERSVQSHVEFPIIFGSASKAQFPSYSSNATDVTDATQLTSGVASMEQMENLLPQNAKEIFFWGGGLRV